MNILLDKFKEILFSVLPIIVLTVLMNFIFIHIEYHVFIRFLIGSVLIIIGLTFFLFGIETGVAAIGLQMGHEITKRNNVHKLTYKIDSGKRDTKGTFLNYFKKMYNIK